MQRSVEILIGRLVTDEDFRHSFLRDPRLTLQRASELVLPLNESEIQALLATNPSLWERVAEELDARLQKASLTNS